MYDPIPSLIHPIDHQSGSALQEQSREDIGGGHALGDHLAEVLVLVGRGQLDVVEDLGQLGFAEPQEFV
jgi:hypothetical protein